MKRLILRAPLALVPPALVSFVSSISIVHAQQVAQAASNLPDVVVTATRAQQSLTETLADVTIIKREAIESSGAVGLADVLNRVPGIQFARNGGPSGTTSVFVRGAETRFAAVFIDGIRVDSQASSGASWSTIPLSQVDRIEVVRGPAAAVYGSDALGGVIQIFTRKGEAGFRPSLEIGIGNHGTRKLGLGLSGAQASVDYSVNLTRETSKGFNEQPTGNPDRDGYKGTAFSGRFGWAISPAHRLEATVLQNDLNAQFDGFTPGVDDRSQQDLQARGLSWNARWTESYSTRLSINRGRDRYESSPFTYLTDTSVTSYLWQNEWRSGGHLATATLERRVDKLNNSTMTPVLSDRSDNALALGYGLRTGAHSLQFNARYDKDSEFGGHSTGSAAYAYSFTPNWRATASVGTAFRAPSLYQRFSEYGVPSLRPETSHNTEIGLKYEAKTDRFSIVGYRNKVDDLITFNAGPGTCAAGSGPFAACYGNTSAARYGGITVSGATRIDGVNLSAHYDKLNAKDLSSGNWLARRARQKATLSADTQFGNLTLGSELQLVGARFNDDSNTQRMGGYGVINLYLNAPLGNDLSLLARIDNAGNRDYETAQGYATGGRTFYAGLRWSPK